jgi:hypothetical protein
MPRETIDFVVLDALADDLEDLEHVLHRANHDSVGWRGLNGGAPFRRADVVMALMRLVRGKLVDACVYSDDGTGLVRLESGVLPQHDFDQAWFRITPHGRTVHASWEPEDQAP